MKFTFDPFKDSPLELIEFLENNQNKMEEFESRLHTAVAEDLVTNIKVNAQSMVGSHSSMDSQSESEISRTMSAVRDNNEIEYTSPNETKVFNTEEEATYAEFGTGMIGSSSPHPLGGLGWEYDVNSHGERGWRYIGVGGKLVSTKGYPAFSNYYNAYIKTSENLASIASKVFKGVFDERNGNS